MTGVAEKLFRCSPRPEIGFGLFVSRLESGFGLFNLRFPHRECTLTESDTKLLLTTNYYKIIFLKHCESHA